jgi:acyl-CoA thioesterase-1
VRRVLAACVLSLSLAAALPAAAAEPKAAPEKPDAALPNILLIGDSISIGYTEPVREALAGKANVYRIPANSGHTANVLKQIDAWLKGPSWAVIHINVGLHDVKIKDGRHQVELEDYGKNLTEIVKKLKATGAKVIWASTTPVPEGAAARKAGDEIPYNEKAAEIMKAAEVPVNDLYAKVKPELDRLQQPKNVHFLDAGSRFLGTTVAESIQKALEIPSK